MADKARHAFGSSSQVQNALDSGKIDAYDILFLDGDTEPKVGWIDKNGEFKLVKNETDLSGIEAELATKANASDVETSLSEKANVTDVESLGSQIATKADASEVAELEAEIANKVDAATVQTMIEEHSSAAIEVVEF